MMSNNEAKLKYIPISKIFTFLSNILVIVALALAGWVGTKIEDIDHRVTTIEANRLDSRDGLELWRAIEKIRTDNDPPKWFIDRIDRMEIKIDNLSQRIDNLASQK